MGSRRFNRRWTYVCSLIDRSGILVNAVGMIGVGEVHKKNRRISGSWKYDFLHLISQVAWPHDCQNPKNVQANAKRQGPALRGLEEMSSTNKHQRVSAHRCRGLEYYKILTYHWLILRIC